MCEKHPAVYILASRYRGTLYAGVTSSLWQRVWDHRNGRFDGFTAKYAVKNAHLVRASSFDGRCHSAREADQEWNRAWKFQLIEAMNPDWRDLTDEIDVNATLVEPKAGPPLSRG